MRETYLRLEEVFHKSHQRVKGRGLTKLLSYSVIHRQQQAKLHKRLDGSLLLQEQQLRISKEEECQ